MGMRRPPHDGRGTPRRPRVTVASVLLLAALAGASTLAVGPLNFSSVSASFGHAPAPASPGLAADIPQAFGPVHPSVSPTVGTLVLSNGTFVPWEYSSAWANVGGIQAVGWDPVSNEIWTSGSYNFNQNLGANGPLAVYNLSTKSFGPPVLFGGGALGSPVSLSGFAFDAVHQRMYVIDEGVAEVRVLAAASTPSHAQSPPIHVGGVPTKGAYDPRTGLLWVVDPLSNRVDLVNVTSATTTTFALTAPSAIAYDAVVDQMFVATYTSLVAYNATSGTLLRTLPLPGDDLAIDPSTGTVYVASSATNVSVVSAPSDAFVTNVTAGGQILAVAYDPAAHAVLAEDIDSDALREISTSSNTIIGVVPASSVRGGVLVDPGSDVVVLGCRAGNNLTVLNATTLAPAPISSVPVGAVPEAIYPMHGSGALLVPDPLDAGLWSVTSGPPPAVRGFLPAGGAFYGGASPVSTGSTWDADLGVTLVAQHYTMNLTELTGPVPTVSGAFPVPFYANDVAYDPLTHTVVVVGSPGVYFLNATTGAVVANLSIPHGLRGPGAQVRFDASDGTVYALIGAQFLSTNSSIWTISGSTYASLANVTLPGLASTFAIDPVGGRIFVPLTSSGTLDVLSATTLGSLRQIAMPSAYGTSIPTGVAFDASRNVIYVGEDATDSVVVVNGTDYAEAGAYPAPNTPAGVAVDSGNDTVYVAGATSGTIDVFQHLRGVLITSFSATPATVPIGNSTTLSVRAFGGLAPYRFQYAGLPPGCTATNASSFGCYPTVAGNWAVTVTVSDPTGAAASASLTLVVTSGPPVTYEIRVFVAPPTCGPISIGGVAYPNGSGAQLTNGTYAVSFPTCPGHDPGVVSGTGNVTANDSAVVVGGAGSVTLTYPLPGQFLVKVEVFPSTCGAAVTIAGASYGPSSTVALSAGNYVISAAACLGNVFQSWQSGGSVAVAGGVLNVTGPGTVGAVYSAIVVPSSGPAPIPWTLLIAIVTLVAVVIVVGAIRMRPRAPPPS